MDYTVDEIIELHENDDLDIDNYGDYYIVTDPRIGKKYRVDYDASNMYDFSVTKNNQRFTYHEDLGIVFGDYVEFIINYCDELFLKHSEMTHFVMRKFKIGDVVVEIAPLSLLFDLASKCFYGDKYYDVGELWTISLKGINADNYEEYLVKALFLLKYYNESPTYGWAPACVSFSGYYDMCISLEDEIEDLVSARRKEKADFDSMEFEDMPYYEALSFYNEAASLGDSKVSFHYYYKVLEYFFLICRQDSFKQYIDAYNTKPDMSQFIRSVTEIYSQKEEIQLENLLNSIQLEIKDLIVDAHSKGIIKNDDVEEFSKELYLHRNSIIHGKSDQRFKLNVPTVVCNFNDVFWRDAVEQIAEVLIKKYCLSPH